MNTDFFLRFTSHSLLRSIPVGLITLLLAILLSLAQPFLANAATPESRFGAVDTFDNPRAATQLGAGWTRVRFPWSTLQPNNDGEWNNTFFTDAQLATELAAGREVVGLIVNTPPWALQDGNVPGVPSGLYLRDDDPNNLWATFVRKIVSRYAGRINHWIIWNEPDIWDPNYPGRTWGGNEKDFFQLLRVAYNVTKATNPNATVHLSAFSYYWDVNYGHTPFFKRLLDEIAKDPAAPAHNYYFDVASANLYFRPDNIYDLIAWHHQQMREHGFDKPIWLTETNAAPSNDPAWPVANPTFVITLDEQAQFMIQSFAMALAAGASRVAVYKMADVPDDHAANPEPFGLVREDGSRRPAFTAFQVASNYLSGFTSAELTHRDGIYAMVTVQRGDKAWTTIAWTRQPAPTKISVPAHTSQAILVDWNGHQQTIAANGGQYTFEIAGATCSGGCIIGGAPRMVVEGSAGGARINPPSAPSSSIAQTATPAAQTSSPANGTARAAADSTPSITTTTPLRPTTTITSTSTISLTPTATTTPASTPTPTATSISTLLPALLDGALATSTPPAQPTPAATPSSAASEMLSVQPVLIVGVILAVVLVVLYAIVRINKAS